MSMLKKWIINIMLIFVHVDIVPLVVAMAMYNVGDDKARECRNAMLP